MSFEQPAPEERDGAKAEQDARVGADVSVIGRRPRFIDVLVALLFSGVFVTLIVSGDTSIVLYALIPVVLFGAWSIVATLIRPPHAVIKDGVFTVRLLSELTTPVANVADVSLRAGKLTITFRDVQAVHPPDQRSALLQSGEKNGFHLQAGRRPFSLEHVNTLRTSLGMVAQQQDAFADFEAALHRLTPRVFVTPTIIAINAVAFLLMTVGGESVLQPDVPTMIDWGANYVALTSSGQWWRLLTSMFLHFGVIHLFVNMWILFDIGRVVERLVGNSGFLLAYLLSGFFGGVASVFWHERAVSAGASGAVFGVFGVLLGFMVFHGRSIPTEIVKEHRGSVLVFFAFNVVLGTGVSWIDQAAHIGGFLAGCVCGLLLGCDLAVAAGQRRLRNAVLAIVAVPLAVLAVVTLPDRPQGLAWVAAKMDEIDAAAARTYEDALDSLQKGTRARSSVAKQITDEIIPAYDELAKSLVKLNPTNDQQTRTKKALMEYTRLRRQGWEFMAEAIATDNLVFEGFAIERFEAAWNAIAAISAEEIDVSHRPPTDLRMEWAVLAAAESRTFDRYEQSMQHYLSGEINADVLADSIERDVLPTWQRGQERFVAAARKLVPEDSSIPSRVTEYFDLQRRAWLLQVAALREQDTNKAAKSLAMHQAAREAGERLWQGPLKEAE